MTNEQIAKILEQSGLLELVRGLEEHEEASISVYLEVFDKRQNKLTKIMPIIKREIWKNSAL